MPTTTISRRTFEGLILSAGTVALGAGDKRDDLEPFHWARVKFNNIGETVDKWNVWPQSDIFLMEELKRCTGLNIDPNWYVASLEDLNEMCKFPFLFMTSDGEFEFTPTEQENLVEYLKRGGFLLVDDCVANGEYRIDAFFIDFKAKIEKLFGRRMTPLPNDHEIYHSFYDLPNGMPYVQGIQHGGHALFIDGRMSIFLSPTDIHCGWHGQWERSVNGYGMYSDRGCKEATQLGINILMYVMTH